MKNLLRVAALILANGVSAIAQQPTFHDPLLDKMQGKWVLQGTIHGTSTSQDVDASWVLEHQYLQLHEVAREKNAKGEPAYEATVFIGWDQAMNKYVCIWLDIWGGYSKASAGYATPNGDTLHFIFNDGKSDFHTVFSYDRKADAWDWKMDNEENGAQKAFARARMTKTAVVH